MFIFKLKYLFLEIYKDLDIDINERFRYRIFQKFWNIHKLENINNISQDILVFSESNFVLFFFFFFFHNKMCEKTKLLSKQLNLNLLELFIVQ